MSALALAALWIAAALAPAQAAPAAVCGPDAAAARQAVVEQVATARSTAGLEALTADPRLCAVAQTRAREVAASGNVQSDSLEISATSRRLYSKGYKPYRWTERVILGFDKPDRLVRNWQRAGGKSFSETVLGDFEDLGVGVVDGKEGTAVVLLFGVPKITELRQMTEPLRDLDRVREIALERVEEARRKGHVRPVKDNAALDAVAQKQAEDMLKRGYYSHVSPEGTTPGYRVERSAYGSYRFVAENIAKGFFDPGEVVDRWMKSRHHRANILHPLAEDTGLGVAFGDSPEGFVVVWVQLFARH